MRRIKRALIVWGLFLVYILAVCIPWIYGWIQLVKLGYSL